MTILEYFQIRMSKMIKEEEVIEEKMYLGHVEAAFTDDKAKDDRLDSKQTNMLIAEEVKDENIDIVICADDSSRTADNTVFIKEEDKDTEFQSHIRQEEDPLKEENKSLSGRKL